MPDQESVFSIVRFKAMADHRDEDAYHIVPPPPPPVTGASTSTWPPAPMPERPPPMPEDWHIVAFEYINYALKGPSCCLEIRSCGPFRSGSNGEVRSASKGGTSAWHGIATLFKGQLELLNVLPPACRPPVCKHSECWHSESCPRPGEFPAPSPLGAGAQWRRGVVEGRGAAEGRGDRAGVRLA